MKFFIWIAMVVYVFGNETETLLNPKNGEWTLQTNDARFGQDQKSPIMAIGKSEHNNHSVIYNVTKSDRILTNSVNQVSLQKILLTVVRSSGKSKESNIVSSNSRPRTKLNQDQIGALIGCSVFVLSILLILCVTLWQTRVKSKVESRYKCYRLNRGLDNETYLLEEEDP